MDRDTIIAARAIIGDLTPLHQDCGALCAGACCRPDEDGNGGMYLFRGEEELLAGEDWISIARGDGFAPIGICGGACPHEKRPLACRIFPLTPVWSGGVWKARMDARARAMCPLAPSGVKGVDRDFARAVVRAIRLIAADPDGEAFLRKWQALEEEYRSFRF